ncbi:hypothetical protein [Microbacterium istanbulense]|uniref:Lipoprotein n=1 Tax=Microbacterium istanbulense TaxID=3122049 RepID=A0ABU8LI29_9MICO
MRRLAVLPLLAVGLLAGCSQVTQLAGEAVGVDVAQVCTSFDDVYTQYQSLLDQGEVSSDQLAASKSELVTTLESLADDLGEPAGDVIRSNAQKLADIPDLRSPEAIALVEQAKSATDPFCGTN